MTLCFSVILRGLGKDSIMSRDSDWGWMDGWKDGWMWYNLCQADQGVFLPCLHQLEAPII